MSHTFADGQTLCPYNPSHVISRQRAISHLTKCRQQHPHLTAKVGICPYNQGHHLLLENMTTHLTTCEEYCASKSVSAQVSESLQQFQRPVQPASCDDNRRPSKNTVQKDSDPSQHEIDEELAEWM